MTNETPKKMTFDEQILFYDLHPEEATPQSLANFYQRLPGGWVRETDHQNDDKRTLAERITAGEAASTLLYSGKRLSQTDADFYASVDKALADAGLNSEHVANRNKEIIQLSHERKINEHFKAAVGLNQTAIPVYLILRKQGYRHYELVK